MAARRTEELLRAALRVPDRIPYADKRAVRAVLPAGEGGPAAEIAGLHARAVARTGGRSRSPVSRSGRSTTSGCSGWRGCRPPWGR
ncbi:hypothetical protein GCM10023238_39210 [Streptomyces heliomycini]